MVGKLFVISAPSGAGKTTLVRMILQKLGALYNIQLISTYTTRTMRVGEKHGVDYHFVTQDEFEGFIKEGFFLEWSLSYGAYYGSPSSVLEHMAHGRSCILILDRSGAQAIKDQGVDAVLIWIYTSSIDMLRDRLIKRNTEIEAKINERLCLAQKEIAQEAVEKLYNYHLLNDALMHALGELENLIKYELERVSIKS